MYQSILVPVDGSKRAESILPHVDQLAEGNDAKVVFLKVEEEPILLERDEVIDAAGYWKKYDTKIENANVYLNTLKARMEKKGINAAAHVVTGPVVRAILKASDEMAIDLIALATHGFSGLARVSYGSVAAGVLQAADIPILLIRSCNGKNK